MREYVVVMTQVDATDHECQPLKFMMASAAGVTEEPKCTVGAEG